jgi:hypothetical protein
MIGTRFSLARLGPRLLALLVVCLSPGALLADTVSFTNRAPIPLVVHTSGMVSGQFHRNSPHLVRPGESTPAIPCLGDMTITVCDAQSQRILFRQSLRADTDRLVFDMLLDPTTGLVHLRRQQPTHLTAVP